MAIPRAQQKRVDTIIKMATYNFDRAVIEFEKMNRYVHEYELTDVDMEHPLVRGFEFQARENLKSHMLLATDEEKPKIVTWTSFSLCLKSRNPIRLKTKSHSTLWFSPDTDMIMDDGTTLVSKTKNKADQGDLQAAWDSVPEDIKEMSKLFAPALAKLFEQRR